MTQEQRKYRILVVDDELPILKLYDKILNRFGYKVFSAASVQEAIKTLEAADMDLVITDYKMPRQSGLDLIRHIKENYRHTEVLMVTGYPSIEGAVSAVKTGASEYLSKPFSPRELLEAVRKTLEKLQASRLEESGRSSDIAAPPGMIGASEAMAFVFKAIARAAQTSATVLICGESGTGKELVARAIHYGSLRASSPFTPVNCGGIPEEIMDQELFGFAREGRTHENRPAPGLFQASEGGTIFFDGIDNLGSALQAKLLRVLEDREVVGPDGARHKVDVRIIASTIKDLNMMVKSGTFRESLFHRINVIAINLPPLSQRGDDIVLLARHFAEKFARDLGRPAPDFSPRVFELFRSHQCQGNVRGLENLIQSLIVMTDSRVIDITDLPAYMRFTATGKEGRPRTLEEMETEYIRYILASVGGNKSKASDILGIDRKTLRIKMKKIEGTGADEEE